MGQSYSSFIEAGSSAKSVRELHAITLAISEDDRTPKNAHAASLSLLRKLEQVVDRPIAKASFLASIWRDFRHLMLLLEEKRVEPSTTTKAVASGSRPHPTQWDAPGKRPGDHL